MKKPINRLAHYYNSNYFDKQRAYSRNTRYPMAYLLAKIINRRIHPVKVLDIGCAKGYLVEAFHSIKVEAWGLDISEYAIQSSTKKVRKFLKICDIDNDTFPFPDELFKLVTAIECMEHLTHPERAIGEIARVITKEGYATIASPKITLQRKLFQFLYPNPVLHPSELTRQQWIKIFAKHGMTYMGDFTKGAKQEWKRQYRAALFAMAIPLPPQLVIGKILVRCGRAGNYIRAKLNNWIWQPEFMLFRKGE